MRKSSSSGYQPRSNLLHGRVILVTGAGDGIGRVAAQTFASYGADILLLGRTRSKLDSIYDEISASTETSPGIVPCDLLHLNEEDCRRLFELIQSIYGRLDGVLHNASILGPKLSIQDYPLNDFESVMRVNVSAQFMLTRTLLPLLELSQDASVVFTSSGVGRVGRAYWGAYAVSKFATEGLMEVLADETSGVSKIRVNSINPGGTRTAMRAEAYPAEDPATLPTAEEHMPLYLYLMGPDSVQVTGKRFDAQSWQYKPTTE